MNNRVKIGVSIALCLGLYGMVCSAADRVRIVNEGGIRDEWMLADGVKLAAPGYPAALVDRGDSVCVAMGYAIKPDGTTSDFTVLKTWSSGTDPAAPDKDPVAGYWESFTQASAGALSQWKFKPRPEITPRPTYTVATMSFNGKDGTLAPELRERCGISDLATVVQKNKSDRYQKGTMEKNEMERYRRTLEGNRNMVPNPGR